MFLDFFLCGNWRKHFQLHPLAKDFISMQIKLGSLPSSGLTIDSYGCGINFHTTEPICKCTTNILVQFGLSIRKLYTKHKNSIKVEITLKVVFGECKEKKGIYN